MDCLGGADQAGQSQVHQVETEGMFEPLSISDCIKRFLSSLLAVSPLDRACTAAAPAASPIRNAAGSKTSAQNLYPFRIIINH